MLDYVLQATAFYYDLRDWSLVDGSDQVLE